VTEASTAAAAAPTATLLLVDDETSVLSALRRLFRAQGYAVEQASSGAGGLAVLAEKRVDLVISDMRMPEMDGAAFLEQVRNRYPDTVRLLLTGYSDVGATIAAINRGEIHRYLAKPWDDQDLLLVVQEALRRRDLELQNAQLLALTKSQNNELQDLNRTLEARVASRTAELEQINQMLEAAYEEMNANFTLAITVFSGMLEMRQGRMAGHARRVGNLAGRMATLLGLKGPKHQDVVLAAQLHDIGKLGFPDAMLAKPVSMYSPSEVVRYQRHTIDGEAALMAMDKLRNAATLIRQHHERFDGRGFPDQLSGDDILLGARIISVASDYDGLESGNLSEKALTPEQTLLLIEQGVGSRYHAPVVAALFEAIKEIEQETTASVELDLRDIQPHMVLARDLQTPKGAILLPAGHRFDAAMVDRVISLSRRSETHLSVHVLLSTVPGGVPAAQAIVTRRVEAAAAAHAATRNLAPAPKAMNP
jgi:response regulator RpfG family c-di-GMP phosphodiesterase